MFSCIKHVLCVNIYDILILQLNYISITETYVSLTPPGIRRSHLAQLRLGVMPLEIDIHETCL